MEPVRKEVDQEVVKVWEGVEPEPVKTASGVVLYRPMVPAVVAVVGAVEIDWEEGKTVAV